MLILPHDLPPRVPAHDEPIDDDSGPDAWVLLGGAAEWLADLAAIIAIFFWLPLTLYVCLVWR